MNFLEQLVAEWYTYQGYFVRTNVRIGKRKGGGYEGEMDVVAFEPKTKVLIHLETSGDAESWEQRKARFQKKFRIATKHYRATFKFNVKRIEQVAVVGFTKPRKTTKLGSGIKLLLITELMAQIKTRLAKPDVLQTVIPEGYPLLRAIQFTLWCDGGK